MADNQEVMPANPLDPTEPLKQPPSGCTTEEAHGVQPPLPGDSATTRAEKVERHGLPGINSNADEFEAPTSKRRRLDDSTDGQATPNSNGEVRRGVAPIKHEYLINPPGSKQPQAAAGPDDDAAESAGYRQQDDRGSGKKNKKDKPRGQNKARNFGSWRDALLLCSSRTMSPEFSPEICKFGDKCKFEHDLRKYLREGKRADLETFNGLCPVWDVRGVCNAGWKCRFAGSHSNERDTEDGRQELVLVTDPAREARAEALGIIGEEIGVVNVVTAQQKIDLHKRKTTTPKADAYLEWMNKTLEDSESRGQKVPTEGSLNGTGTETGMAAKEEVQDNRAQYVEAPFLPSEKRRIYYGPETPVLAPLTTQGNLPFRRLAVELGAQVTWSEMAMGLPLVQGEKSEWALMKAHESEISAPRFSGQSSIVTGYDNSKDLKFGAQIAANKPWIALKTTEVLTALCPHLRAIDLNCGCPIELVCRQGAGASLLDSPGKLEKILRGMNAVSNEIPITVKIRTGTKDSSPTADKLVKRLVLGGYEAQDTGAGASGVAAITLHGRSRQQRYTKRADWSYISDCAALIGRLNEERDRRMDTVMEADPRHLANDGKVYFIGNGDCYSHVDYNMHLQQDKVDAVMVARGALIKPWIFEEIEKGQYLDKSATERLSYVEKFAKYGLEAWGSDEIGVGTTRRFLLEWLSFAHRYVPLGILEHLPPHIQDRPPRYRGRNDLETLMASEHYKDWIKISEMFLGPAHPDFKFEPKHKSNAYEIEAEG